MLAWNFIYSDAVDDFETGYSTTAAIEDLDGDFLMYRKFGWLHNYALLYSQDEIIKLQDDLEGFNKWEARSGDKTKSIQRRRNSPTSHWKELINTANEALAEQCLQPHLQRRELTIR